MKHFAVGLRNKGMRRNESCKRKTLEAPTSLRSKLLTIRCRIIKVSGSHNHDMDMRGGRPADSIVVKRNRQKCYQYVLVDIGSAGSVESARPQSLPSSLTWGLPSNLYVLSVISVYEASRPPAMSLAVVFTLLTTLLHLGKHPHMNSNANRLLSLISRLHDDNVNPCGFSQNLTFEN
ncbi:hypothetical protein J6590_060364 [Homalodisca vitripennis]|nr:hypothetical protein J6590_060364 [Homalodisca vitripennis]